MKSFYTHFFETIVGSDNLPDHVMISSNEILKKYKEDIEKAKKTGPTSQPVGWKKETEEDVLKVIDMLDNHNANANKNIKGYYTIDVTGKFSVYYTFWRHRELDKETAKFAAFIKTTHYMQNLTTNLVTAVEKAIRLRPSVRIFLEEASTKTHVIGKPLFFKFGKYRGMNIIDVYNENPQYFIWLDKNSEEKYSHMPFNQAVSYFAILAREEVTNKNKETSISKFVGNVGEKYKGTLTVYRIDTKSVAIIRNRWSTTGTTQYENRYYITAVDQDGNKFKFKLTPKKLEYNFNNELPQKDDVITVQGKIDNQAEYLGIKFNMLGSVKLAK
jgi:hypothetical protein